MRGGWLRWSPDCAGDLLRRVLRAGRPRAESEVLAEMDRQADRAPGAEQSAWEEPELYRDPYGTPLYDLYQEVMEDFYRRRARVNELAGALGLPPVQTAADTADYLVAAGILCRVGKDDTVLLIPVWPVPLPEERLPLTAEERRAEATQRWTDLHERTADRIIELFAPDDERLPALRTSVDLLARQLDIEPEDVRQALLVLLAADDFSADADIARLGDDGDFVLTVDWDIHDRTR
jgi:hypothetical protein